MTDFQPRDPAWESRVRSSFSRQPFMAHLGARLSHVAAGEVDIDLPFRSELGQQHGYFHAGPTSSIADSAAGYAALSLFPAGCGVLTTEFKVNLLNPARPGRLVAQGRVIKPGHTLTICRSDVYCDVEGARTHVATGLFSMMCLEGLED